MTWLFRSVFVLLIHSGINIYSGLRILSFIRLYLPSFKAVLFWPFYALLPYGIVFVILLKLYRIEFLRLAGMYLPPFFFFLFGFIVFFDIVNIVLSCINRHPANVMPAGTGAAVILAVLILALGTFHARDIKTAHYSLDFSGTEKLRIALVSDLHIGSTVEKKWIGKVVDRINETEADLVV